MTRRVARVFVAGLLSLVGCGGVLGYEDIVYRMAEASDAATEQEEASPPDASPAETSLSDASDAGTDAPVVPDAGSDGNACINLILNPGFESAASCAPWIDYGGVSSLATRAHSGANACRSCTQANAINVVANISGATFAPGDKLHFELWARAEDSQLYARELRVVGHGGSEATLNYVLLSDTYERFQVDHVVTENGGGDAQAASMQLFVLDIDAGPDGSACILFDDVTVCATRDGG